MYYKLIQEIGGEHFGRPEYSPILFEYEKPVVNVCIRNKEKDDGNGVVIETKLSKDPKKKIQDEFTKWKSGFYLDDENIKYLVEDLKSKLRQENEGGWGYTLPYDILPEYFRSYCLGVVSELTSYSSRTYKTIRWIQGIGGSNHPFSKIEYKWSFDEVEWFDFPSWLSGELNVKGGLYSSPKLIASVTKIVQSGGSEPLSHELLREAYSIKFLNPRSALLIAVSAAEAAIKRCIIFFKPETQWLIENTASPDIITLYRDYIHGILIRGEENQSVSIPQKTILDPLRKIIGMRNKLAHGGTCSINENDLVKKFRVISNLLWVIDLHTGNEWASNHIDSEVKKEMGI